MELLHIDLYYHKELKNIHNVLKEIKKIKIILINLLNKLIHGKFSNKEDKI
jgi:hypothetical protein